MYFSSAASEGRKEGSKQQVQPPLVSSVKSPVEGSKSCATSQKLKCELVHQPPESERREAGELDVN